MKKATFIERVLRGRYQTLEEEWTNDIEKCWLIIEERASFLYSELGRGLIESQAQAKTEWLEEYLKQA